MDTNAILEWVSGGTVTAGTKELRAIYVFALAAEPEKNPLVVCNARRSIGVDANRAVEQTAGTEARLFWPAGTTKVLGGAPSPNRCKAVFFRKIVALRRDIVAALPNLRAIRGGTNSAFALPSNCIWASGESFASRLKCVLAGGVE